MCQRKVTSWPCRWWVKRVIQLAVGPLLPPNVVPCSPVTLGVPALEAVHRMQPLVTVGVGFTASQLDVPGSYQSSAVSPALQSVMLTPVALPTNRTSK